MKALKKGDKLALTGFGTFSVAKRKARTGRIPKPEGRSKFLPPGWQNSKQVIC